MRKVLLVWLLDILTMRFMDARLPQTLGTGLGDASALTRRNNPMAWFQPIINES